MNEIYTCAICEKIYEKMWSDEEANAEAKEIWGVENASEKLEEDMAVICDPCFKKRTMPEILTMGEEYKQTN